MTTPASAMRLLVVVTGAVALASCGYERWLADREIDRLCKLDGYVTVFAKDELPPSLANADGTINVWALERTGPDDAHYAVKRISPVRTNEPAVYRFEWEVRRRVDRALLGTSVGYIRQRDSLGAFSLFRMTYSCPEIDPLLALAQAVFTPAPAR